MRFFLALLIFTCTRSACGDSNQQIPLHDDNHKYEPFSHSFNHYVEDRLKDWHTPGVSIAVINGNETWTKGYGYADLAAEEPVTPYTLFQAASNTKVHTASLVALLVEDNHTHRDISFDTKLHDITPEFTFADMYESTETTFADALSHRTGMPRHDFAWVLTNNTKMDTTVQSLRHLPRSAPFRTKWQYCNLMYTVVANALQAVTRKTIGELYTAWLWQPLNMTNSFYSINDAQTCQKDHVQCKISKHYAWTGTQQRFIERDPETIPIANGPGGWITNAIDAAKWVRSLAHTSGPLSPDSHKALRSALSIHPNAKPNVIQPFWYGMGLMGNTYHGHLVFHHTGGIGGYVSLVMFMPELNWGFVLLQNAPNDLIHILAQRLVDDFLQIPKHQRIDADAQARADWEKTKEEVEEQPKQLYPTVPHPPQLPALPVSGYAGTYTNPGYGNITLVAGLPTSGLYRERPGSERGSEITLHVMGALLETFLIFDHVSGENWLVEAHAHEKLDDDIPDGYMKAKSEIGGDGRVEAFYVIMDELVQGGDAWVKFVRT